MQLFKKKKVDAEVKKIINIIFKKKVNFNKILLDSLLLIKLVLDLEKKFKIKIPVRELNNKNFCSLESIVSLIKRL
jgi:acyl carrier protein